MDAFKVDFHSICCLFYAHQMFQVLISFLIWTWALESRNVKRQWFYWRRKLIELVVLSWKLLFHCPYKKQFRSKWKSPIHIMFVYIYRWWRLSRSNYYISGIHIDWVYFGGIHRNWVSSVTNFYVFHLHTSNALKCWCPPKTLLLRTSLSTTTPAPQRGFSKAVADAEEAKAPVAAASEWYYTIHT